MHAASVPHEAAHEPPQSVSLSSPFVYPSKQLTQIPPVQLPDLQSVSTKQSRPSMTHKPLAGSDELLSTQPARSSATKGEASGRHSALPVHEVSVTSAAAHGPQSVPPQSMSVSSPFSTPS